MKRLIYIVGVALIVFGIIALGVVGVGAFLYYQKVDLLNNPVATWLGQQGEQNSAANVPRGGDNLTDKGGYKTESNWLASQIAQEIAGMAWMAQHPDLPLPEFKIKAQVDEEKGLVHLEMTGWPDKTITDDLHATHAWDPSAYAEFAHQLLGDKKAVEPADTAIPDTLNDLLTPTADVLANSDVKLSQALQQNPASATLHEKAALLLETLALREDCYLFTDTRLLMCRACAHLAIGQALTGAAPTSWTGKVSTAGLTALTGREVDALQQIDLLKKGADQPPAASIWLKALALFSKQDWRMESPNHDSPLLLKLIWARVTVENFDDSTAETRWTALGELDQIPDWGRILLESGYEPSVDVGHRFCTATVGLEFQELKTILTAENVPLDEKAPLKEVFKDGVGSSVTAGSDGKAEVRVVGVDLFKDISERHLFNVALQTHMWMKKAWGVPDEDAKLVAQLRSLFKGVRNERYLTLLLDAPDLRAFPSSGSLKSDLADIPPSFALHVTWPHEDCERMLNYFAWGVPFGTAFELETRCTLTHNAKISKHNPKAPSFQDLMPLAPDSYTAASWVIVLNQDTHVPNTRKNEYELLSRFLDYNAIALGYLRSLANKQNDFDDAAQEELLRKETALDPDENYHLGDFLMTHGKPDEAAEAYRKGARDGHDLVYFANSIDPLVRYDFEHGQVEEADTMAKKAAEVFSATGIETYIWLLCQEKKFDEAEDLAQKEVERYGGDSLAAFYVAHADHFADKAAVELKRRFPNGMPVVTLASFTDPPRDGCLFHADSPAARKAGIIDGDVVVALDSHPVHSSNDYTFLRDTGTSPDLNLIIWRGGKYIELKAAPLHHRFGNSINNYQRP